MSDQFAENRSEPEASAERPWAGLSVREDGRVIIEMDSTLKNTLLIIAFRGFMLAAISLIFILDSVGKTGIPWLVNGLLILLGGGILRYHTDDHYFLDPATRSLGIHRAFRGQVGEERLATADQPLGTAVDAVELSEKRGSHRIRYWAYRPILALRDGRYILLHRRVLDFPTARKLAEAVADGMELPCLEPREKKAVALRPVGKSGEWRLEYGKGLDPIVLTGDTAGVLVAVIVTALIIAMAALTG